MALMALVTQVCDNCGHDEDAHDPDTRACLVGWTTDVIVNPCRCVKFRDDDEDGLSDLLFRHKDVSRDDKGFVYCTGCDEDLHGSGSMLELWRKHVQAEARKEGLLLDDESKHRNRRLERKRAALVVAKALRDAGADESWVTAAVQAVGS